MNPERRYTEEEVGKILDRATEADLERGAGGSTGLTLRELHEIGKEVGISEEVITQAATSLDRPAPRQAATQTFLGQTIGVGRTVEFPRPLTDKEWNRLVVDLRETFDAKGKILDEGPFRQWTNGNLQALLEPTDTGQRLRLRTLKSNARSFQGMGAGFMLGGVSLGIGSLLGVVQNAPSVLLFGVMGAAFFLSSRLTVPQWARTRTRQFDEIIARLTYRIDAAAIESGDPPST